MTNLKLYLILHLSLSLSTLSLSRITYPVLLYSNFSFPFSTPLFAYFSQSMILALIAGVKLASAGFERLVLKDAERETHSDG